MFVWAKSASRFFSLSAVTGSKSFFLIAGKQIRCNNIPVPMMLHSCGKDKFSLKDYLYNKISTTGPIPVAEFMKTALTSKDSGYYMHKDMLGLAGDFVTSPELSQMFGELIAAWILNEWNAFNKPPKIQIVELGPGRGTLCVDILRTFNELKHIWKGSELSLHLVEVSPALSKIQFQNICCDTDAGIAQADRFSKGRSSFGIPVFWYKTLDDVHTSEWTVFIAHEFFDALPIHKFVKMNGTWKEIYVDIDNNSKQPPFRFVVMNNPTLACKALIQDDEPRQHVEVSPEAALISRKIAQKISEFPGAALFADYGHFGTNEDTLRAFKRHSQVDVLSDVGNCDITADVDFKYMLDNCRPFDINIAGPVSQCDFLRNLGIDSRLMMLLRSTVDKELRRRLIGSYDVMVNPNKMGNRFQFMALTSRCRTTDEPFDRITGFG